MMSSVIAVMGRMARAGRVFARRGRMDRGTGGQRRIRPEVTGNDQGQQRQAQDA